MGQPRESYQRIKRIQRWGAARDVTTTASRAAVRSGQKRGASGQWTASGYQWPYARSITLEARVRVQSRASSIRLNESMRNDQREAVVNFVGQIVVVVERVGVECAVEGVDVDVWAHVV